MFLCPASAGSHTDPQPYSVQLGSTSCIPWSRLAGCTFSSLHGTGHIEKEGDVLRHGDLGNEAASWLVLGKGRNFSAHIQPSVFKVPAAGPSLAAQMGTAGRFGQTTPDSKGGHWLPGASGTWVQPSTAQPRRAQPWPWPCHLCLPAALAACRPQPGAVPEYLPAVGPWPWATRAWLNHPALYQHSHAVHAEGGRGLP